MTKKIRGYRRVSIVQAKSQQGNLVTLSQAARLGLVGLSCPLCMRRVRRIAQSCIGARAHFRHIGGECNGPNHIGAETLLHFLAKNEILEQGWAFLPLSLEHPTKTPASDRELIRVNFSDPEIEASVEKYQADLLVRVQKHWVAIEVKVSSFCSIEKLQKYAERGISVVEVTMPPGTGTSESDISRAVRNLDNWRCLINARRLEQTRSAQSLQKLRSDLEIDAFLSARPPVLETPLTSNAYRTIRSSFANFVLRCPTEPSYFLVPPDDWQQAVLDIFLEQTQQAITLKEIFCVLVERALIASEHLEITPFSLKRLTHDEGLASAMWVGDQPLAREYAVLGGQEVQDYLMRLAECGLLQPVPSTEPIACASEWTMQDWAALKISGVEGHYY